MSLFPKIIYLAAVVNGKIHNLSVHFLDYYGVLNASKPNSYEVTLTRPREHFMSLILKTAHVMQHNKTGQS